MKLEYTLIVSDEEGKVEETASVRDDVLPREGESYGLNRTGSDNAFYEVVKVEHNALTTPRNYKLGNLRIKGVQKAVTIQRLPKD